MKIHGFSAAPRSPSPTILSGAASSPYAALITTLAPGHEPRHVEAFMRSEFGTFGHLSPERFRMETHLACLAVEETGAEFAERLARSFGL